MLNRREYSSVIMFLFLPSLLLMLASSIIEPADAFEFANPEDCNDVCDGTFAFRTKTEAEECCSLTRSLTDNTFPPTSTPTIFVETDTQSGGNPGTTASCRNLGGPKDTSVRVRYGEDLDQCLLCVGATMEGNECGAPSGSTVAVLSSSSRVVIVMVVGFAIALVAL